MMNETQAPQGQGVLGGPLARDEMQGEEYPSTPTCRPPI